MYIIKFFQTQIDFCFGPGSRPKTQTQDPMKPNSKCLLTTTNKVNHENHKLELKILICNDNGNNL